MRKFEDKDIGKVIKILGKEVKKWDVPVINFMAVSTGDPFKVLISTVLSLRTKDDTTADASKRLFSKPSPAGQACAARRPLRRCRRPTPAPASLPLHRFSG